MEFRFLWDFGFWPNYLWTSFCYWIALALATLGLNDLSEWLFKTSIRWLREHRGMSSLILLTVAQAAAYHALLQKVKPEPVMATSVPAPIVVPLKEEDPQAMSRIQDLKRELTDAIINAPLKSRVVTATASVKMSSSPEVARTFTDKKWSSGHSAFISFSKSKEMVVENGVIKNHPTTLRLASNNVERWGNETIGTDYYMEFQPELVLPVNVTDSVGELLDSLDVVELNLTTLFPRCSELRGGIITLTLNSVIKKTFAIPKAETNEFGQLFLIFTSDAEAIVVGMREVAAQ